MNHWQLDPKELLKEWRRHRQELQSLDDENDDIRCLEMITDWWKMAPIATRVIDPYNSEDWPDPWELLHNKEIDENVVALGMAYTLELIDWPCRLELIQDIEKNQIKLIVSVDDEHILNYSYGTVDSFGAISNCEILRSWESHELTR